MIQRFNSVSLWCGAIIVNEIRLKNRAKAMAKFIKIAKVGNVFGITEASEAT